MSDYIKREDAVRTILASTADGDKAEWCIGVIQSVPAADVVEQKHGKWNPVRIVDEHGNEHPFDGFQCSNCGNIGREWMQYCFNCGAKMDGE